MTVEGKRTAPNLPCPPSLPLGVHLLESQPESCSSVALGSCPWAGWDPLLRENGIRNLFLAGSVLGNELNALDIKPWLRINDILILRNGKGQKYQLR